MNIRKLTLFPLDRCTAKLSEGKLDLEWTGMLNMIVDAGDGVAGRTWRGPARGRISNIDSSRTEAACTRLIDLAKPSQSSVAAQPTAPAKRSHLGGGSLRIKA